MHEDGATTPAAQLKAARLAKRKATFQAAYAQLRSMQEQAIAIAGLLDTVDFASEPCLERVRAVALESLVHATKGIRLLGEHVQLHIEQPDSDDDDDEQPDSDPPGIVDPVWREIEAAFSRNDSPFRVRIIRDPGNFN